VHVIVSKLPFYGRVKSSSVVGPKMGKVRRIITVRLPELQAAFF